MKVLMEFATPIGIYEIDNEKCVQIAKLVEQIISEDDPEGHNFHNLMKTTPDNLHQRKEFLELKKDIDLNARRFAEDTIGIDFNNLTMTGMWSNIHSNYSSHHSHTHPNSFLSGVLYLRIPAATQAGNISFTDPRSAKNMTYADFYKSTCVSNRNIYITPVTGMLLLFPSWLEHSTDIFISSAQETRISLSFNYFLTECNYHTMKYKLS